MALSWMPTKDYGRFPYEHLEDTLSYIADKEFEVLTYNDLPWEDDYDYTHGFPQEYQRWLDNRNLNKVYLFLQHDVDMFPERTLRIMELERELGLKSNIMIFKDYHDRAHLQLTEELRLEEYLTDEVMRSLQEYEKLGFVIGYHINAYEQTGFDLEKAHNKFRDDVLYLRKFFDIKFCSPHGGAKDKNGKCNFIVSIPEGLNIRWVNNYYNIKYSKLYTDSNLLRGKETVEQFLDTCRRGNRYHLLIHPQFYHTPWKDWREE